MTQNIVEVSMERPTWAGRQVDEREFVRQFDTLYPMIYSEGFFLSADGIVPTEQVQKKVYDYLYSWYSTGLVTKTNALMEVLRLELHRESTPNSEVRIHCANGTYNVLEETFTEKKDICRCRLPVRYNPQAPRPTLWLKFLGELLEPEDILTLQEYMGYCLLPVNYAQKMLMIIGNGGEGKSRIGIILHALLGQNMVNGSLTKLETNRFARADLQNRLVMVDDDLQMEALTTTGTIKSIITAEQPMDLERKGLQSHQGILFCRLIAFGNGSLRALHDRSHGFFRRQIILSAKPRQPDRKDDPYLAQAMKEELEGILLWCIQGLIRLLYNEMRFTLSRTARENLRHAEHDGNNVLDFLQSEGYIRFDEEGQISSRKLNLLYRDWCEDNALAPLNPKSFTAAISALADRYHLQYSTNIPAGEGRHVRGFRGIRSAGGMP